MEFPSPQWGLWCDKTAITHVVVDVVGVDAIYNRHYDAEYLLLKLNLETWNNC